MTLTRRVVLRGGGGFAVAVAVPLRLAAAQPVEVEMRGTPRGNRVWFAPIGLAAAPGTVLRFVNRDPGNSHTSTTYHPDFGRPLRIPAAAAPWDSGLLLPGEAFDATVTAPGVYDIFCVPHEAAGMVMRVVVGTPRDAGWQDAASETGDLPESARAALPPVEQITARGRIMPEGA